MFIKPFNLYHITKLCLTFQLVLFFFLSSSYKGCSQEFIYENFTIDDGLPSSECYDVIQDEKGYIWVATDKGIAKYNGQEFKVFDQDNGLKSSVVFRLFEKNGRIWFFTYNKWLQYIDGDSVVTPIYSGKLRRAIDSLSSFPSNLSVNHKNELLIALEQKEAPFYYFYVDSGFHVNKEIIKSHNQSSLSVLYKDSFESIFCGSFDDLNGKSSDFYLKRINYQGADSNILLAKKVIGLNSIGGLSAVRIGVNGLVFSALNQIYCVQNTKIMDCISLNNALNGSLFAYGENHFGVGRTGSNPLITFNLNKNQFSSLDSFNVSLNKISGGYEDNESGLWMTSLENGLYYVKNPEVKSLNDLIGTSSILGIRLINDEIWVANNSNVVTSLSQDKLILNRKIEVKGEIYSINTTGDTLLIVSSSKGQYLDHDVRTRDMYGDMHYSNDSVWYAGIGTILLEVKGEVVFKAEYPFGGHRKYQSIFKREDWVYLGTLNGLQKFNISSNLLVDEEKVNPLIESRVNDICAFQNHLLLATNGSGLIIVDKEDSILTRINASAGLSSNFCNSIYQYNDSIYWISTNKGVSELLIKQKPEGITYSIRILNEANGLPSNEVTHCLVANDRLFVGTKKGLCFLNLNQDFKNKSIPKVYLGKIKVNDVAVNYKKVKEYQYLDNNFHFYFVGLTYKTRGRFNFEYRLNKDGSEEPFSKINQPSVQFSDLSPGKYTYEVVAVNNDNVKSSTPAKYVFVINPPWWATWWFRILVVVLLAAVVYFLARFRDKEIKTRNELKLRTKQLRQQALNAQLNPHFIFNTMGSIQSLIMDRKLPEAEGYLTKFSKMLRTILSTSDEHFSMLKNEIDLVLEYVKLENLRFESRIDLVLNIQKITTKDEFRVPTLLILTIVENAILHGILPSNKRGRIVISAFLDENDSSKLKIFVEDNGIGINKSREKRKTKIDTHKSKGLKIIKNRLEIYSSLYKTKFSIKFIDLSDENEGKSGTRVEISAPYKIFVANE